MIKCYFVEVKNIISSLPKSNFQESEIEKLAGLILEADGLVRPLILQDLGGEKYMVIEGHLEYYAAVRAKEKNLLKAEEVNAFVVPEKTQKSATDQLALLSENQTGNTAISTEINFSVEQLLSILSSAIAPQLEPILNRLNQHKKVLDTLEKQPAEQTISPNISQQLQLILDKLAEHQKILDELNSKKVKPTPKVPALKWIETADPTKVANTLGLINTLDRDNLIIRMKQSKISNAVNLGTNIIAARNDRPGQKFDTWEKILAMKISSLGDITIKKIIENLK
jgi:hypothetical protein